MNNSFEILFKRLGLNNKNGLLYFQDINSWSNLLSFRILRAIEEIKPFALYLINNNPIILFIDNTSNTNLSKINSKIWNFQVPIIIIDNGNEWNIFNGYLLSENKTLTELFPSIKHNNINENEDIENLTFWNLQSGKAWKIYEKQFLENKKAKDKKRLDTYLLENINGAITLLTKDKTKINHYRNREIANNLIGRLIYSRYLIDRGVDLGFENIEQKNQKQYFEDAILNIENLYAFFAHLRSKFNGNLFPLELETSKNDEIIIEEEKDFIKTKHLEILHELFTGNDLNNRNQLSFISLFDIYDFNIIPIELISNIYEQFIGIEGQKKNKSFYTPPFLVDYVLKYTVEPHLTKKSRCKVLDPSCGSGIFLVETLRKITEKNIQKGKIKRYSELLEIACDDAERLKELIKENDVALKSLVQENIFGIDKDEKAINIAKFSIYITLLDYKEPKEIEHFRLPELENNFVHANFLNNSKLKKFKNHNFDFIIGNPPWGSVNNDKLHSEFVKQYENNISDLQIAQSFVIQASKFVAENKQIAFVLPSKGILYNSEAKKFRDFLWQNFELNRVLELSAVRRQIFTKAIAPTAILFLTHKPKNENIEIEQHNEQLSKNTVNYISLKPSRIFKLFKVIVIEKYDYKKIAQKHFVDNDWIWKVILYGSTLDFRYLKELLDNFEFKNLDEIIYKNELTFGNGFKTAPKYAKKTAENLKPHLIVSTKDICNYYINKKQLKTFSDIYPKIEIVDRTGVEVAYNPPHLLIKRAINIKPIIAFCNYYCIFPSTIYGVHGKKEQTPLLKTLGGLFSTSLFSYLMFQTSSQWGVERDEIYKQDYMKTPINVISEYQITDLASKFDEATKLAQEKYENPYDKRPDYNFDKLFYDIYGVDKQQKDLIDYALNVSIPLFRQKEEPFKKVRKEQITKYANVFKEFFTAKFKRLGKHLKIDVYYIKKEYITVNIQVNEKPSKNTINFPEEVNPDAKFEILTQIFSEPQKITNDLYIQKDVKGFEKTSFYVVKPNEYKNWHPAIAHLDVNEFYDAIMKSGMKKQKEDNA